MIWNLQVHGESWVGLAVTLGSQMPLTVCGSLASCLKSGIESGDSVSFFCSVFMENLRGLFLPQTLMLLYRITTKTQSSMMR